MTQSPPISTYLVDGLAPGRVEQPRSVEDLSGVLRDARGSGETVIPWGGGTRMHVGNVPSAYDVAVDLKALDRVIEYEPADMTVIAEAGLPVGKLQRILAKEGQRLAVDPAHPQRATVGGILASNAPSPMRSGFGGIRDWTIGLHVVEADGTATKSGGKVVKNVQGFDLVRTHIGALGTLGVITQAAFKLVPLPQSSKTVAAWFTDLPSARDASMQVFNGPFVPESLSLLTGPKAARFADSLAGQEAPEPNAYLLLVRVAGGKATVERQANEMTGLAGAALASGYAVLDETTATPIWAEIRGESDETPVAAVRCSFRPSDAFSFVERLERHREVDALSTVIHVGVGMVLAHYGDRSASAPDIGAWIRRTFETAAQLGTAPVAERCPTELKADLDVWADLGPTIAIMRRLKEQFDPKGVLNRGRFAARL